MSKVKIVVDSSSDIPPILARKLGIIVVPMPVTVGNRTFLEGIDLFTKDFYPIFNELTELPKTSQPNLQDLVNCYNEAASDGSEIVAIHLSSGLSGTVQTAVLAKDMVHAGVRVEIVDSLNASLGYGLLAVAAAKLVAAGASTDQVIAAVEKDKHSLCSVFTPGTLEYLIKGGRVNRVSGAVGTLLDIKPLLHVTPAGELEPFGKIRGRKQALRKLAEKLTNEITDPDQQTIGIAHAACQADAEFLATEVKQRVDAGDILISDIGCTIGSHTGPGCIALFYRH
ncbi:MAG: DegV family protein [Peptococcaceae bacterium]|nr:DegV family protein [Peptococcaceae bacterium]